jgi:phage portal protein BeeE
MILDFFRQGGAEAAGSPEAKASAAGRVSAWGMQGRAAWGPRDTAGLMRTGFAGNPVGFRCVKMIAEAAAALPLVLQDSERRFAAHPVLDLVARPNPAHGRAELFEALYGQLLLSGNAFVEAVGGGAGVPLELHVLRSDRMSVVPGADGWPVGYEYQVGGRKHRFHLGEGAPCICHIRSFHPQDDHYGLSPLQPAAQAIDVHNAASRWSKALLDNAARPSGAIVYKGAEGQGNLTEDQYTRLVAEMEAARGRAGLEADGILALGHGIPEDQGSGGARDCVGLWRAADAAGHSRRRDIRQLPGGEPRLLPPDGAAAGGAGHGRGGKLAARL